jgi:hypothetical protein
MSLIVCLACSVPHGSSAGNAERAAMGATVRPTASGALKGWFMSDRRCVTAAARPCGT